MTQSGCAAEEVTSKNCNAATFRVGPQGKQLIEPLTSYLVQTYGKNWGLLYPDYAFGQSQLAAFKAALADISGALVTQIPVPLSDTNLQPYVSKAPTDGSIVGIYDTLTGGQLTNSVSALQQFGIIPKLRLVVGGGKEGFAGVYPEVLSGAVFSGIISEDAGSKVYADYLQGFREADKEDTQVAAIVGGDKGVPGNAGLRGIRRHLGS